MSAVGNIGDNTPFWRSEYVYGDEDMPILMYNEDYDFGGYPLMLAGEAGSNVLVEGFPNNPYLLTSTGSNDTVRSLDIIDSSFNYRHVAYGSQRGDVHILDIDNREKLTTVFPFGDNTFVKGLRYHHTNDWLASSGGGIKILDSSSQYSTIETITGPNEDDYSAAWGDEYLFFVSFTFQAFESNDTSLVVVDPTDWSIVHTDSIGSATRPDQASVDRNNGWYAVNTGGETSIFNTTSPWNKVASVSNSAVQVEFSPDGNWLSVGSIVYDTSDWSEAFSPSDASSPVAFGPNSELVGYTKVVVVNNEQLLRLKFINIGDWTVKSTFDTNSELADDESLMFFDNFFYE